MPAKPLTPEQKADAAELMKLFKEKAAEEKAGRLTQATLADDLGYTTQSAVSQYLNGKVPLNIDASIKFATRFGCRVSDFSPSIQQEIDRIAQFATKAGDTHGQDEPLPQKEREPQKALSKRSLIERYDAANEETRAAIDLILLPQSERTLIKKSLLLAIAILEEGAKEALQERKKDAA